VKIGTANLWNKIRRPEIIELFRKNVYGRVPESLYKESYKVVRFDGNALDGAATLKEVYIKITADVKALVIHLTLITPNSVKKAVPTFLLIDNWGPEGSVPSWKVKGEFWPVKEAIERGYGMAVFRSFDLDPDNFDNFKDGIHELLNKNPRPDDAWGTIAAWAWGASRCMDYLVTDKNIDPEKVAGLSLLLDIMATILSGGLSTHQIHSCSSEHSVSQVFIAINIKNLQNFPAIDNSIHQIIEDLHKSSTENVTVKIQYPGENVVQTRNTNLKDGIPVNKDIWEKITGL